MEDEGISRFSSTDSDGDHDDNDRDEEEDIFPTNIFDNIRHDGYSEGRKKEEPLSIEIYAGRLKRRIELIREMRTAYLRDVVLMKQLMTELLTNDERELILKQKEAHLPSLNLEKFLLSRPPENSFNVLPCASCGGTVEIVHHDSEEIQKLTLQLQNMDQKKSDFRLIIATKTALLDQVEEKLKITERKFREEKAVLCTQIKELKHSLEIKNEVNDKLESSNRQLSNQVGELKTVCAESLTLKEEHHQSCIELERIVNENRVLEDLRRGDREQINNLNEKTTYLMERKDYFEKLSNDLMSQVTLAKQAQSHHQQISETAQKLNIKLQTAVDTQQKLIETLRADKSDLLIELETLKEESGINIQEMDKQNEKLLGDKEVLENCLSDLREQHTTMKSEKELIEREFNELYMTHTSYRDTVEPKLAKLEIKIGEVSLQNTELHCEIENLQKGLQESRNQVLALEAQILALQDTAKSLEKQLEDTVVIKKRDEEEKDSLKTEIEKLKKELASAKEIHQKEKSTSLNSLRSLPRQPQDITRSPLKAAELKSSSSLLRAQKSTASDPSGIAQTPSIESNLSQVSSSVSTNVTLSSSSSMPGEVDPPSVAPSIESSTPLRLPRLNTLSPQVSKDIHENSTSSVTSPSPLLAERLERMKTRNTSLKSLPSRTGDIVSPNDVVQPTEDVPPNPKEHPPTVITAPKKELKQPRNLKFPSSEDQSGKLRSERSRQPRAVTKTITPKKVTSNAEKELVQLSETTEPQDISTDTSPTLEAQSEEEKKELEESEDKMNEARDCVSEDQDDDEDGDGDTFNEDDHLESSILATLVPKGHGAKRHTILSNMNTDEFSEESSSTGRMINEAIFEILTDHGLGAKVSKILCRILSPVVRSFSQIISKLSVAVLRSLFTLQHFCDSCSKISYEQSILKPKLHISEDSGRFQILQAHNLLRDIAAIQSHKKTWMKQSTHQTTYTLDIELFNLFDDQADLSSNQRKIAMSAFATVTKKYFGYSLESRNVKLDRILDSIYVIQSFYDTVVHDVEKTSHAIDLDWTDIKISSLDGLLLAPEAKRAEELTKRNLHLGELSQSLKTQLASLEDAHLHLTKNYQDLEKHAQKIETENNIRRDKIVMLEQDLSYEKAMHTSAATSLANLIEAERARIEDLKSVSIQTMIPTREYETQTEFVVPPISLRHRLATSDRPTTTSSNMKNQVFYPIVTAGGGTADRVESSLSHSINSLPWSNGLTIGPTDDDNISVLSNDSSSLGSMSTYETATTWNEMRPLTHSQFSRSQPALLPKLKKSRSQKLHPNSFHKPEDFSAVEAFFAQSLPTTPIKRISTSNSSHRKLK